MNQKLEERIREQRYRQLPPERKLVDFCSNDYLGFARSAELKEKLAAELERHPKCRIGATGSRLISGNSLYAERLEEEIAFFHHAQTGLLFNSGYTANLGLLSCLPQRGDIVICDELCHASIMDGIRLSWAVRHTFRHNDLGNLEEKLRLAGRSKGKTFVVVESLYSMDGDEAPLEQIVSLCEQYGAAVIVDEAHAGGVFGKHGRGLVPQLGLEERVFARVYTFGKALGCHGAIVVGARVLKNYLLNFARPFIYTTGLPFHDLAAIKCAYEMLVESPALQEGLRACIKLFRNHTSRLAGIPAREGPIQVLPVPGNAAARHMASQLQEEGFDLRAILSPTVPAGSERLRICLHLFNQEEEIRSLASSIARLREAPPRIQDKAP